MENVAWFLLLEEIYFQYQTPSQKFEMGKTFEIVYSLLVADIAIPCQVFLWPWGQNLRFGSLSHTLKTGIPVEEGDCILKLLQRVSRPEIQLGVAFHSELDFIYFLTQEAVYILVHFKFLRVQLPHVRENMPTAYFRSVQS